MKNAFVVISSLGPNRDRSKGVREQPFWDEHAAFIDQLVDNGFILMGGPLVGPDGLPQGALLIVKAEDENEVTEKLKDDPSLLHMLAPYLSDDELADLLEGVDGA
jgi:uncharacterized protein YciI